MREMKVYGTSNYFHGTYQCRAIVAARTKKRAAELLEQSMHTFNEYAAITKNEKECEIALAEPEKVHIRERY